jgi:hypothetical protein
MNLDESYLLDACARQESAMSVRHWLFVSALALGLFLPAQADDKPAADKPADAAKKDDAKKDDPAKKDEAKKPDATKPEMKKDDKKADPKKDDAKKDDAAKKGDAAMKKDDKKDEKKDKKPSYRFVGNITGQITQMGEGGSTLTVRVTGVLPTWVQTYDQRYGRWRVNPNYNQPNVTNQDFDVILADDCKVRLPVKQEFDEKGKPKPMPKVDPKEDPDYKTLGGSKGEASDLARGQIVTVAFGQSMDPKNPQVVATMIRVERDKAGFKKGNDR